MWESFIAHLEETDPLIFTKGKEKVQLPHTNFLGSIESYKRIFLEANK